MSWRFHPPPGWPPVPGGWVPPPGWAPDPRWPPAPAGWQFWLPAGPEPLTGPTLVEVAGTDPPGSAPPAGEPPGGPAGARWFGPGWAVAGLVALLLVGSAVGYGGTRVAQELASGDDLAPVAGGPTPTGGPEAPGTGGPSPGTPLPPSPGLEPTRPAGAGGSPGPEPPPGLPPLAPPPGGFGNVCGDVALIMLALVTATANEQGMEPVLAAWRTAAGEIRELPGDGAERAALDALAAEIETAARTVAETPGGRPAFEAEFQRISDAYLRFNDEIC